MHIMDAISKMDTKAPPETKDFTQITGQISLRREFFGADYDPSKDPVGTEMTYHQLQTQIHDGLFLCDTDDEWYSALGSLHHGFFHHPPRPLPYVTTNGTVLSDAIACLLSECLF
jgi:hypothetical protein